MNRIFVLLPALAAFAAAGSNLDAPVLGIARDAHLRLRPVYGVAGNFVLRDAIPETALNWSFDGAGGLIKTDAELLTLDRAGQLTGRRAAPRGHAVLGTGAAFFASSGELWLAAAHSHRTIHIEPEALGGDVVALGAADGRSAPLAVCRASRVWLVTVDVRSGAVTRETLAPGAIGDRGCAGALVWLDGNFLLATSRGLTIHTAAGVERHVSVVSEVHGAPEMHRAGERWVQVEVAGAPPLLILVTGDGGKAYRLPAVEARP